MIIVGEKINTSRKRISEAVEQRDAAFIQQVAADQADAGAHYIDVNAGTFVGSETEHLCWLVETVQSAVDLPVCLDSPDPVALEEAIKRHRGRPMINSISLEKERYDALLPVITAHPCRIVALCMAETSMPVSVEDRFTTGAQLIERLTAQGFSLGDIFVDPLVQPVSVDTRMGPSILGAINRIMSEFPGVQTICGLSNISYGLPARKIINRNFLVMAMACGLSAAILDPTDMVLTASLLTGEMLLDRDEFCERFIDAWQEGRIEAKT